MDLDIENFIDEYNGTMVIRGEKDGNTVIEYYLPEDEDGDHQSSKSNTIVQAQIESQVQVELDIGRCEDEEPVYSYNGENSTEVRIESTRGNTLLEPGWIREEALIGKRNTDHMSCSKQKEEEDSFSNMLLDGIENDNNYNTTQSLPRSPKANKSDESRTNTLPSSNSEPTNEAKSKSMVQANVDEDDDDDIIFLGETPSTRPPQPMFVLTENSSTNTTRRMVMGHSIIGPDGKPGFNLYPLNSAYKILPHSSYRMAETPSLEGSEVSNDSSKVEGGGNEAVPVQVTSQGKENVEIEEQSSDGEGNLIIDEDIGQGQTEDNSREDPDSCQAQAEEQPGSGEQFGPAIITEYPKLSMLSESEMVGEQTAESGDVNFHYAPVSDNDDKFGEVEECEMTSEVDIDEEPESVPSYENEEKVDFFWNGLDRDDELVVKSKQRPPGMNWMCALCYDWFETKEQIKAHMNELHLNGTRFHHCKICNARFVARFLLLRHEKLHKFDPKLPYSCYVSPRGRPIRELVDNHYLYRVRPGRLTEPYLSDLRKKLGRLAAQIYSCIECEATFSTDSEMTEHYEKDHAIKKCLFCRVACDTFEELKQHLQNVHSYRLTASHEAVYWKFWAKVAAKAESPEGTEATNSSMFHSYSKPSGTVEAEKYYKERSSVFEDKVDYTSKRSDEEVEKDVEEVIEESKVGSVRRKRKESFTKAGSGHSPVSFQSAGSGVKNELPPENRSMGSSSISGPSCIICHRVFVHVNDLEKHYRSHKGERPFVCQFCGRGFATNINRREHERSHTVAAGDKPYKCQYCERQFVQSSNLKKHIETHKDKTTLSFKCTTCEKEFTKEASLILHQRAHASDRKFRCHLCDRAYNYASLLKRHLRIHSGEMPYECDMCGMLFHELVSLHYHRKKIHTMERPHKCQECGRAFILSSDLKKHMGVHKKHLSMKDERKEMKEPVLYTADLDLDTIETEKVTTKMKSKRLKPNRQKLSEIGAHYSKSPTTQTLEVGHDEDSAQLHSMDVECSTDLETAVPAVART